MATLNLVFGAANFGLSSYSITNIISDPAILQQFLNYLKENGINQIDTARRYGNGTSEELLGSVKIADQGFLLDTKIISTGEGSHLRDNLRDSVAKSLEALKVKKVHTMYLHAPDRSVPITDVLHSINELYQEGLFENFGISNYTAEEVTAIVLICKEKGYKLPTVYQGMYNIFSRKPEEKLLPILKQENISFYAYSPLAGGLFNYSSKEEASASDSRYKEGSVIAKLYGNQFFKESFLEALAKFDEFTKKANITKNETALRWLVYHSQLKTQDKDAVILGASKISQLESNIGDIKKGPLSVEIVKFLDEIWESVKNDAPNLDFVVLPKKE